MTEKPKRKPPPSNSEPFCPMGWAAWRIGPKMEQAAVAYVRKQPDADLLLDMLGLIPETR